GSRPEEARKMCVLLGEFLRRSLALGARERVPLSEELALAADLLAIEKVRFGVRLDARRDGERLLVAIANPRDAGAPPRRGPGIGIENVRPRLETLYGRDAELRLRPE